MLHPDYQYDATRIPDLIAPIIDGERDLMLGSRFLGDPLAGGMPTWKYVANRFLTGVENVVFGLAPVRVPHRAACLQPAPAGDGPLRTQLGRLRLRPGADRQVVAAGMADRIGEIAVPTRYFAEASSVGFQRSVVYGLSTLEVVGRYLLHRLRLKPSRQLVPRRRD